MQHIIKSTESKYLLPSLELVQEVFSEWDSPEEGKAVRQLVEEIRAKNIICLNWILLWLIKMRKLSVMRCFLAFILKESMKMNC